MRILVAGGAGFLGCNLCKKLLEDEENYIVCVDNFSSGKMENIEEILNDERFEILNADISEEIDIDVDHIYNAACPASPKFYQNNQLQTFKTCIKGTENLLKLAQRKKANFLQFSTSEIYGNPLEHPQNENYFGNVNTLGIRSCYDEGKRAAETLCYIYNREHNVKTKIVRIFNTYGPKMREDDGRVIPNFIIKALKNETIEVYGDGTQTRSLCYVDDLIDGIIRLMNSKVDYTRPVNLGNDHEITINELAEKIINLTNSKSLIKFKPLPEDDPIKRKPDLKLANKMLDYYPRTSIDEGLKITIDYFKNCLKTN